MIETSLYHEERRWGGYPSLLPPPSRERPLYHEERRWGDTLPLTPLQEHERDLSLPHREEVGGIPFPFTPLGA